MLHEEILMWRGWQVKMDGVIFDNSSVTEIALKGWGKWA